MAKIIPRGVGVFQNMILKGPPLNTLLHYNSSSEKLQEAPDSNPPFPETGDSVKKNLTLK